MVAKGSRGRLGPRAGVGMRSGRHGGTVIEPSVWIEIVLQSIGEQLDGATATGRRFQVFLIATATPGCGLVLGEKDQVGGQSRDGG